MHDLIVIGSGAAGLAAATYALTKQLDVVLIGARLGGRAGDRQRLAGQSTPGGLPCHRGRSGAGAIYAIVVARRDALHRLPVQAVFVDLGLVSNVQMVRQLVQLDAQGFIGVDDQNRTSLPRLFAAGDVTSACGEQMLIVIGEGRAPRAAPMTIS